MFPTVEVQLSYIISERDLSVTAVVDNCRIFFRNGSGHLGIFLLTEWFFYSCLYLLFIRQRLIMAQ
jgi:hypothetical protein